MVFMMCGSDSGGLGHAPRRSAVLPLDMHLDGPDEGEQLAADRGDHLLLGLALADQPLMAAHRKSAGPTIPIRALALLRAAANVRRDGVRQEGRVPTLRSLCADRSPSPFASGRLEASLISGRLRS